LNVEADLRIQLSSIKLDIKENGKWKTIPLLIKTASASVISLSNYKRQEASNE